jgi:hypothetical protein
MLTRIKILKITFMALRLSVNRPMPFSFTYESVREICVTALSCFYIREWRERKNEIAGFVILARDDRQCTLFCDQFRCRYGHGPRDPNQS